MSTEHQKYSTENQADAIRQYALRRGFEIVRTYADQGKSGLRLDGRDALKKLIDDVQRGAADFSAILVYDVSRWGRFQDADESAYYEYICKRVGIKVEYCAEQFENDGSPVSTIVKGVKRAMAGEYSRELSAKVFAGQCRLIEMGFRQGGSPGFGLRRRLVDQAGNAKGELAFGEHKSIQTDRVILVPGPQHEVDTVRRMYQLFVRERKSETEIAQILNAKDEKTDLGRSWTRAAVHQVLINEKYIGNNVWNRKSFKLKKKLVSNRPEIWIRAEGAFEPIVDLEVFTAAQAFIEERSRKFSNEDMLDILRGLIATHGYLSGLIIDESDNAPSSGAYRSRFGSLLRAYTLVGYSPERNCRYIEVNRAIRSLYPGVITEIKAGIERAGGVVIQRAAFDALLINDEFTISVVIARCRRTSAGALRWHIQLEAGLTPDITVAVRMNEMNQAPLDYYLLPRIDVALQRLRLAEHNGVWFDAYRFETLRSLFDLSARTSVLGLAA
jgi:DNA invertase Pin-like site-specific DNA recombinase